MKKFRKKSLTVEAFKWEGGYPDFLKKHLGQNWGRADARDVAWPYEDDGQFLVVFNSATDSWIPCPVGYWIVCGINYDWYPLAPDIFEKAYEEVI